MQRPARLPSPSMRPVTAAPSSASSGKGSPSLEYIALASTRGRGTTASTRACSAPISPLAAARAYRYASPAGLASTKASTRLYLLRMEGGPEVPPEVEGSTKPGRRVPVFRFAEAGGVQREVLTIAERTGKGDYPA